MPQKQKLHQVINEEGEHLPAKPLFFVWYFVLRARKLVFSSAAVIAAASLFEATGPFFLKKITSLLAANQYGTSNLLIFYLICLVFISYGLSYALRSTFEYVFTVNSLGPFRALIRERLWLQVWKFNLEFFQTEMSGRIADRIYQTAAAVLSG